jgi:hypothetical protein
MDRVRAFPDRNSNPTPPPIVIVEDRDGGAHSPASLAFQSLSGSPGTGGLNLLQPHSMSADGDPADASAELTASTTAAAAAVASPFNFQTQVISTAPVKSVRNALPLASLSYVSATNTSIGAIEHRPASWSSLQAQ